MTKDNTPVVPDDVAGQITALREAYSLVAMFPESKPDGFMNLLALRNLTPEAADTIETQAAELARLRSEAETTSAALSQAWGREAVAIAQRDAALGACNQARLAFGGYVSQQSAVDKLDAALSHPDKEPT